MSRGDIITTARELRAMPLRTVIRTSGDEAGSRVFQRGPAGWSTFGTGLVWSTFELWGPVEDGPFSAVILYLPGETPRRERAVKAEAWAEGFEAGHACTGSTVTAMCAHRKSNPYRIEAGEV